jgi:hypothetical protein
LTLGQHGADQIKLDAPSPKEEDNASKWNLIACNKGFAGSDSRLISFDAAMFATGIIEKAHSALA